MDHRATSPELPTVLDRWPGHLATAVATGLATTYLPVQRWSRPARWALHGGMGVLAATGAALFTAQPDSSSVSPEKRDRPPFGMAPGATAALALGVGAVATGASRGGQAADTWIENRLTARGVRRPRRWMGAVAAAASLAIGIADSRWSSEGTAPTA